VTAKLKLESKPKPKGLTFQEVILKLMHFWDAQGCVLQQPYDTEVGAGTMHPETFLRVLGKDPYRVAFVQPSRRPADGRRDRLVHVMVHGIDHSEQLRVARAAAACP